MIYLVLLYWYIGVYVILKDWLKDFDIEFGFFLAVIILFWIIWPIVAFKDFNFTMVKKND